MLEHLTDDERTQLRALLQPRARANDGRLAA
jgi:hypothetical protein